MSETLLQGNQREMRRLVHDDKESPTMASQPKKSGGQFG